MDQAALRKRIVSTLIDKIDDTNHPSTTMLDRVEAMAAPEDLSEYTEILLKKLEATRFPSSELLNRLDRLTS